MDRTTATLVLAKNGKDTIRKLSESEMSQLAFIYNFGRSGDGTRQPQINSETGKPICDFCGNDYPKRRLEAEVPTPHVCVVCATTVEQHGLQVRLRAHQLVQHQQSLVMSADATGDNTPGRKTRT